MNDEGIAVLIVTFVLTQIGLWADQRRRAGRTDGKIDDVGAGVGDATDAAELAAKRSEPTANGFASEMRRGMATVIEGQAAVRDELKSGAGAHPAGISSHPLHRVSSSFPWGHVWLAWRAASVA
jgi:hypothetical protein